VVISRSIYGGYMLRAHRLRQEAQLNHASAVIYLLVTLDLVLPPHQSCKAASRGMPCRTSTSAKSPADFAWILILF